MEAANLGRCVVCGSDATGAACSDEHARRPRAIDDNVIELRPRLESTETIEHLMRANRSVCG